MSESHPPYLTTPTVNVPFTITADSWETKAITALRRIRAQHKDAVIVFRPTGEMCIYQAERAGRIAAIDGLE